MSADNPKWPSAEFEKHAADQPSMHLEVMEDILKSGAGGGSSNTNDTKSIDGDIVAIQSGGMVARLHVRINAFAQENRSRRRSSENRTR